MKFKSLFFAAIAAVFTFAACEEMENGDQDLGNPSLTLSVSELSFDVAGGEEIFTLTATRDWKLDAEVDWIEVNPTSGAASADAQTITVSVGENKGINRSESLVFTIGTTRKTVTVSQEGAAGSAEDLVIYQNDFDKEEATKTYGSGSSWPYLDQFEGWKNDQDGKGTLLTGIEYAFSGMSARANSTSDSNYSDYAGSGKNNMFFGSNAYLAIKNIFLGNATGLTMTFGTEKYDGNNKTAMFDPAEFHVYVSNDGAKWVELTYSFAGTTAGRWNVATANFTVPANTTLSVCVKADAASVYRLDDLKISSSEGGTAINFSNGVALDFISGGTTGGDQGGTTTAPESKGKKTVAEFITAADANNYYELTGTVSGFNSNYCSFDLEDASGKIYVYSVLAASKTEWASKIANGGTITIYGKYLYYEHKTDATKNKHEVIEAHIVSYTAPAGGNEGGDEGGEDTPTTPVTANSADFDGLESSASYNSYTTPNGWSLVNCAIQKYGTNTNNNDQQPFLPEGVRAACINGKTTAQGTITSPEIAGGCGTLSFNYAHGFSETNGISFKVEVLQGGTVVKSFDVVKAKADAAIDTAYSHTETIDVVGSFSLKFSNNSPTNSTSNKDRYSIWNITWTSKAE